MSVWKKANEEKPPLNEDVLILYKHRDEELKEENLLYGIASWTQDTNFCFERWTYFTEYPRYFEVIYWTPLVDMPHIEEGEE